MGRGLSTNRLSRAVAPDDKREGLREDDRMVVIGTEAADALDEHLVDGAHGGGCGFKPPGADEIPPSFGGRLSGRLRGTTGAIQTRKWSTRVSRSERASASLLYEAGGRVPSAALAPWPPFAFSCSPFLAARGTLQDLYG